MLAARSVIPDINEKVALFQQTEARIEATYLNRLNRDRPLHNLVATITRLFLTKLDLIL